MTLLPTDHNWPNESRLLKLRIALTSCLILTSYLAVTKSVSAEQADLYSEFEKCRLLGDDQTRLACLKKLVPKTPEETDDSWPLIRTHDPRGGPDAVSIMRTADTTRSDPELAGLIIRCAEKSGLETVLALVKPVPPRSRRDVVVLAGTTQVLVHAEVTAAGTALLLPVESSTFTTGPWRNARELIVKIDDPEGEIRGVIPIGGAGPAIARLSATCPSG